MFNARIKKVMLLLIILAAAALRSYNIYSQPPHLPDEMSLVWSRNLICPASVLSITFCNLPLQNLILFLSEFLFFSLGYIFGYFPALADFDAGRITDIWMFLLVGRLVSVIFGVATVYVVYLIGKKIKNEESGLIGALFLTFMFLHIENSRYVHYMVLVVFFMSLSLLFLMHILFTGKLKYYLLAGFFIGYGGAVKYTSFFGVLPLFLAHALRFNKWRESLDRLEIKKIILGVSFIVIGFLSGYPLAFKDLEKIVTNLKHYGFALMVGWPPGIIPRNNCWSDYLPIIYQGAGAAFFAVFICGLFYCIFKRTKATTLLIWYVLIFYSCLGILNNLTPYYVLPLLPSLAIIGAYFLVSAVSSLSLKKYKGAVLVILSLALVIPSGIKIAHSQFYKRIKNKEVIKEEFLSQYIPKGIKLLNSNQQLVDSAPIINKVAEVYFAPHFKEPLMDTYQGQAVKISGKIIFEGQKGELVRVSLRSKGYYSIGPADIASVTLYGTQEYTIPAPINFGEAIIKASAWLPQEPSRLRSDSQDLTIDIGSTDTTNINLRIPSLYKPENRKSPYPQGE